MTAPTSINTLTCPAPTVERSGLALPSASSENADTEGHGTSSAWFSGSWQLHQCYRKSQKTSGFDRSVHCLCQWLPGSPEADRRIPSCSWIETSTTGCTKVHQGSIGNASFGRSPGMAGATVPPRLDSNTGHTGNRSGTLFRVSTEERTGLHQLETARTHQGVHAESAL